MGAPLALLPLLGKATTALAAGTGVVTAAPVAYDILGGGMGRKAFNEALSEGPEKNQEGKLEFNPSLMQRLLGVDSGKLMTRFNENQQELLASDPRVQQYEAQLGAGTITDTFKPGTKTTQASISRYLAPFIERYKSSVKAEKREENKQNELDAFNSPTNEYIREQANLTREENRAEREAVREENREARRERRAETLEQRIADRELSMLKLGADERMFDKRLAAEAKMAQKQKMAAIIAGLSNLGASFAI